MKNMGEDRRIRKSKAALRKALIELLDERPIQKITINELCELADVNRTTFYYHYEDIYDLYKDIEDLALEELSSMIQFEESDDYHEVYLNIIRHISRNRKKYRVLLSNGGPDYRNRSAEIMEAKYVELWSRALGRDQFPDEFYFLVGYDIGSATIMIERWLADDCRYPEDKLIELMGEVGKMTDRLIVQYL